MPICDVPHKKCPKGWCDRGLYHRGKHHCWECDKSFQEIMMMCGCCPHDCKRCTTRNCSCTAGPHPRRSG